VGAADRRNALSIVVLGLMLGTLYFIAIDLNDPPFSFQQQQNVVTGEAGSPYRYRVLVPFLLESGSRTAAFLGPREVAYLTTSFIYDGLALTAQMLALYGLTRQWFSPGQALVGVAFTTSATLATFGYFLYQPWSILEVMFFALGFWMAYRERWTAVMVTVVLASLNRETGVFLPLALLLASLERADFRDTAGMRAALRRPAVRRAFGLVVLSTAIFAGLRLVRGGAPPVDQLADVWSRNLDPNNLTAAGMVLVLFLGLGWIFAALGFARAPDFIRGVARVIPFYLAAFAIWGWWREARILTTLYPILVPLLLAYCYAPPKTLPLTGTSDDVASQRTR
jgi:hypothetical protein